MSHQFPHDAAFLPRTKLSYINLPGLLSDGKRDRTARVAGFVCIQLGARCYLVFVRGGEPFHSGRIQPGERGAASLSEVLRLAATESERGEGGQIGYFGAGEAQLQAMLATLVQEPVAWEPPLDLGRPEAIFGRLRERCFSGVMEMFDGERHHYLEFHEGAYRCGWFSDRDPAVAVPDFVRSLFEAAAGSLEVLLFPALDALPLQAGPGLVDLYRRVIGGVLRELSTVVGRETAFTMVRRGQALAAMSFAAAAAFQVTDEGRIAGDPVATPEALGDAVAAWLTETMVAASDHHGVDPAATIEKVARDSRFVLHEQGFFARLPWALAL
jgi:hypothetical protein